MQTEKIYMAYMAVVLVILVVLGALVAGASRPLTVEEQADADAVYAAIDFCLRPVSANHGKDAVIVWEDAGMEAHIRFLLNRPEGEIRRSDVWDIQILSIQTAYQSKYDIALDSVPQEGEYFTRGTTLNNSNCFRNLLGNQSFPSITSLSDLRYFDSLQVLSIGQSAQPNLNLNLAGIENCRLLNVLEIINAEPFSLHQLEELPSLGMLFLSRCGRVDLLPLKKIESLEVLSLIECEVPSLQVLQELPELRYLNLMDTVPDDGMKLPDIKSLQLLIDEHGTLSKP